jgi:hypothetical protein
MSAKTDVLWLLVTVATLVTIVSIIVVVVVWYGYARTIDSVIDRAQVAADAQDMFEYMVELKGNLEAKGLTKGHFALVFKMPSNDLALHYRAINRSIERLELLKSLDKASTAYQTGLDDIRGAIRELPNPAGCLLWARYGWWLLCLCVGLWIFPIVSFSYDEFCD